MIDNYVLNTISANLDLDESSAQALAEIAGDMAAEDGETPREWISDPGNWSFLTFIADNKVHNEIWSLA